MGFLSSFGRFLKSALGLAEGKTERLTDKMVTGSPEAIRSQFRKTKEDWNRDYQEMRNAIAELINIRDIKVEETKKLEREAEELQQKMAGAIELYKKNPDERYKAAYGQLAERFEANEQQSKTLSAQIDEQHKAIEHYKVRLTELQNQISALNKEEAETVADIISSQKIKELNDRLTGLSVDSGSKNLEAVRNARQRSQAIAKLSTELSGTDKGDLDAELKRAGSTSKFAAAFDAAVGSKGKSAAKEDPFASLPSSSATPHVVEASPPVVRNSN